MKRNSKIDENALVADKTEIFNLSGSQVKNLFPTTGIDSIWQI